MSVNEPELHYDVEIVAVLVWTFFYMGKFAEPNMNTLSKWLVHIIDIVAAILFMIYLIVNFGLTGVTFASKMRYGYMFVTYCLTTITRIIFTLYKEKYFEHDDKKMRSANSFAGETPMLGYEITYPVFCSEGHNEVSVTRAPALMTALFFLWDAIAAIIIEFQVIVPAPVGKSWNAKAIFVYLFLIFYLLVSFIKNDSMYISFCADKGLGYDKNQLLPRFKVMYILIPPFAIWAYNFCIMNTFVDFFNDYGRYDNFLMLCIFLPNLLSAMKQSTGTWAEHYINGRHHLSFFFFIWTALFYITNNADWKNGFIPAGVNRPLEFLQDWNNTVLFYRTDYITGYTNTSAYRETLTSFAVILVILLLFQSCLPVLHHKFPRTTLSYFASSANPVAGAVAINDKSLLNPSDSTDDDVDPTNTISVNYLPDDDDESQEFSTDAEQGPADDDDDRPGVS